MHRKHRETPGKQCRHSYSPLVSDGTCQTRLDCKQQRHYSKMGQWNLCLVNSTGSYWLCLTGTYVYIYVCVLLLLEPLSKEHCEKTHTGGHDHIYEERLCLSHRFMSSQCPGIISVTMTLHAHNS